MKRVDLAGARRRISELRQPTDSARSDRSERPPRRLRFSIRGHSGSLAASVLRGFVLPLILALVLFAGLVYFIFPTTTWLDQRAEASEVRTELAVLNQEQDVLRNAISRMRTDDEVERIARRDFNFVYPGEEAYAVLPAPPEPVSLPTSWPFNLLYAEVLD